MLNKILYCFEKKNHNLFLTTPKLKVSNSNVDNYSTNNKKFCKFANLGQTKNK